MNSANLSTSTETFNIFWSHRIGYRFPYPFSRVYGNFACRVTQNFIAQHTFKRNSCILRDSEFVSQRKCLLIFTEAKLVETYAYNLA